MFETLVDIEAWMLALIAFPMLAALLWELLVGPLLCAIVAAGCALLDLFEDRP